GVGLVAGIAGLFLLRGSPNSPPPVAASVVDAGPVPVITREAPVPLPPPMPIPIAPPRDPSSDQPDPGPDWSRGACNGVTKCYERAEAWGDVSGKLTATIGPDGRAKSATYEGGAPWKARQCLIDLGKSRALDGYDGPGGKLSCTYKGTVLEGV